MTRLPPALQPLWPAAKVAHRAASRTAGRVTRSLPVSPDRAVPATATLTSTQTAAAEPDAVRVHRCGPAEHAVRDLPVGTPRAMRFWGEVRELEVPERFVLEVADGRLVGDYAATITPGGRLDLQTSPYFRIRGWQEHPIYLRPRLPEATPLDGTTLSLSSQASGRNYYHSLMDTLPRWGVLQEALPGTRPDHVVVSHRTPWDRQLLAMAGIDAHRLVEPVKHLSVRADRLLVPCLNNHHTLAPRWVTQWLRDHLPAQRVSGRPTRLFVTRGAAPHTRRFVREAELMTLLAPLGFERLDPGAVSVQEQIDHFAAAEVVVAPHGAGLANLNFAPAGVRVLELFAPRYLNPGYWAITDNVPDSVYRYLVADPAEPDRPERRMLNVQDDIDIDPRVVLAAVEELLAA
ncbi:glycosyltransferase family 61 protein [Aeromicrobium sp. CFBP 8757]|uniref:glycosyltransferase family 61 protein n=1 Tax=Aeromicrobium sp. CFBP 8757 TaxID=2775288 RepID=UPI001785075C|nr:glycosyltransferase 61 family protein [Aeromicrobium sp. CFBP 8757]MBD8606993.1 glycosyltransferase family 61 protein [Aeromicrobium sp. CFBP 8757]